MQKDTVVSIAKGTSPNLSIAKKIAIQKAKVNAIKFVRKSNNLNDVEISGIETTGEKTFKNNDGSFTVAITVKILKKNIK